jgi:glutathionyl-hydroquinone reductase
MGMLIDGEWRDVWYDTSATGGRFVRQDSAFRNWVTADGAPGPTGEGGFPAERGRYHLYVSLTCPWAHRTLIMRRLKELEDAVSLSVVHWRMREEGRPMRDRRSNQRRVGALPSLCGGRAALHRTGDGPGSLGQGAPHHLVQRIRRHPAHVQQRLR